MAVDSSFGPELRRRRLAAGMSLHDLAGAIFYHRSYISRVERRLAQASEDFVRSCEGVLRADGGLVALLRGPAPRVPRARGNPESGGGTDWPSSMLIDAEQVEIYAARLYQLRRDAQSLPTHAVLRDTTNCYATVCYLAATSGPTRDPLTRLAARFAEFAGWMSQEVGRFADAHRYTEAARQLDPDGDLAVYTWVRHAEIHLFEGESAAALAAAAVAFHNTSAAPRVRALAAHRIAQVYSSHGREQAAQAALDDASRVFDRASTRAGDLGTTNVVDVCTAIEGMCYFDLGRFDRALTSLTHTLAQIPPKARRVRAIYGARLSLTHAAGGDLAGACSVGRAALEDARYTWSGTATADLARLARHLGRRPAGRKEAGLDLHLDVAEFLAENQ